MAEAPATVVVATRDRAEILLSSLDRLTDLPERPPVIVVDNGSSDGTVERVRRRHPAVRTIACRDNRGSAARTLAVRAASTELVAFCDDDSWWAPGSLAVAAAAFAQRPRLGLLAARVLVGSEARPDPICRRLEDGPVLGFLACGAIVRRSAYLAVGGFHPRLGTGGEEELLAIDLASGGWELGYDPRVVAHHCPPGRDSRGVAARRRLQQRNALCVTWMRRRPSVALRRTARALRGEDGRGGLRDVLACLGWVLRERRPVPRWLEGELERLG